MSQHPHPSITARHRALAAFALLWLAGIILVVASGFSVDGYMLHVPQIPRPHPYPLGGVVATCLVLTFECALIYAVIRPASYEGSWGRALSAVFVAAIELVRSAASLMHAPPYIGAHCLFLFCLTVALMATFFATLVTRAWRRHCGRQN